jgi:putative Holliday junction resolvase
VRYLGVDPGKKRIGLAISDPGGTIATPLKILQRQSLQQVLRDVASLCRQEEVGTIVVGLPLNMDGTRGPAAQDAEQLASHLAQATGLAVQLWDERLSSVSAERSMLDADLSRSMRRRRIDKVAAQIILQGFLDARGRAS